MGGCYGLAWQGLGSGGATGVASVRSCEKLPPCLIKPVPAGSKTDPPLAKAKTISNSADRCLIYTGTCQKSGVECNQRCDGGQLITSGVFIILSTQNFHYLSNKIQAETAEVHLQKGKYLTNSKFLFFNNEEIVLIIRHCGSFPFLLSMTL